MAKKKRRKKSSNKKASGKRMVRATKKKIQIVLGNLILFAVLTGVSYVLYRLLRNDLLKNLFSLLSMVLGFVGLAFLIVLVAFLILKFMKR